VFNLETSFLSAIEYTDKDGREGGLGKHLMFEVCTLECEADEMHVQRKHRYGCQRKSDFEPVEKGRTRLE